MAVQSGKLPPGLNRVISKIISSQIIQFHVDSRIDPPVAVPFLPEYISIFWHSYPKVIWTRTIAGSFPNPTLYVMQSNLNPLAL